jgi:hypothetical protein
MSRTIAVSARCERCGADLYVEGAVWTRTHVWVAAVGPCPTCDPKPQALHQGTPEPGGVDRGAAGRRRSQNSR